MSSTTHKEVFEAINQAYEVFENFSSEQAQIIETEKIKGKHTPGEWLAVVSDLMRYDQMRDDIMIKKKGASWRNLSQNIGCFGIAVFIVALVILEAILELSISAQYYVGFLVIVIASSVLHRISPQGRLFAEMGAKLKKLEKINLPNFFREIVVPILVILREEIKPNHPLLLEVYLDKPTFLDREDILKVGYLTPTNYRLRSTKQSEHVWFKFSARLHDGSAIRCEVSHIAGERYFVKYKRKGNKTKYKYNIKLTHDIRLVLPKARYKYTPTSNMPILHTQTDTSHVFRLKSHQKIKGISMISGDNLPSSLEMILGYVKNIYNQITPVEA